MPDRNPPGVSPASLAQEFKRHRLANQGENGRRQLNEGPEEGRHENDDRDLAGGHAACLVRPGISSGLAAVSYKFCHGTPSVVGTTT